jgi:hypothetical protein
MTLKVKKMFIDELSDLKVTGYTQGSVLFIGVSDVSEDNANFYWDDVNNRLGIGTASPTGKLHINSDQQIGLALQRENSGVNFQFKTSGGGTGVFQAFGSRGTLTSTTKTLSGDTIFKINTFPYDGGDWSAMSAAMEITATENGDTGSGGKIVFKTVKNADPALANTQRLVIDNSGYVGIGSMASPAAMLEINNIAATDKGLVIKGAASQSGDLQRWENSSSTILSFVDASGNHQLNTTLKTIYRGSAIYINSNDDGHLDLTADTSIDLNDKLFVEADGDTYWTGDGSGLPYGHMYGNTARTVTVASSGTWYEVDVATPDFITGELNEVTFSDHYLQVSIAGRYKICLSVAMSTTAAGDEVAATVAINGTASETAHAHGTVVTAGSAICVSGTTILDLAANDQISFAVQNHSAVRDITVAHANMTIEMVGGT